MSKLESQLDRLMPALTARERAVLVLQALKAGREEDPQVRKTMPPRQVYEFNRLMGLMNAANHRIDLLVMLIIQSVEKLELKHGWFCSLQLLQMRTGDVISYLVLHTREPVTESEHRRLLAEARSELTPIPELAEVLLEGYEGWRKEDYAVDEGASASVKEAAWQRMQKEKEAEIVGLVQNGVLLGKKKGRQLLINTGSFYDWLGKSVPLIPDWGRDYEVLPDEQAEPVERLQADRLYIRESLLKIPLGVAPSPLSKPDSNPPALPPDSSENMVEALREGICTGIERHWSRTRRRDFSL